MGNQREVEMKEEGISACEDVAPMVVYEEGRERLPDGRCDSFPAMLNALPSPLNLELSVDISTIAPFVGSLGSISSDTLVEKNVGRTVTASFVSLAFNQTTHAKTTIASLA